MLAASGEVVCEAAAVLVVMLLDLRLGWRWEAAGGDELLERHTPPRPSVLPRIARKRRTTCLVGRLEAAQKSAGSKRQPWPTGVTKREVEFLCQSIQGTGYDWVFTSSSVLQPTD